MTDRVPAALCVVGGILLGASHGASAADLSNGRWPPGATATSMNSSRPHRHLVRPRAAPSGRTLGGTSGAPGHAHFLLAVGFSVHSTASTCPRRGPGSRRRRAGAPRPRPRLVLGHREPFDYVPVGRYLIGSPEPNDLGGGGPGRKRPKLLALFGTD